MVGLNRNTPEQLFAQAALRKTCLAAKSLPASSIQYHSDNSTGSLAVSSCSLWMINKINQGSELSHNALLATMDWMAWFTNVALEDGLSCLKSEWWKRPNSKVSTQFILEHMRLILYNNMLEFRESYWQQNIGASMGSNQYLIMPTSLWLQ